MKYLKRFFRDDAGSTLVEGMVALTILSLVIVVMFSLIATLTLGRQLSSEMVSQGTELISIQDEAALRVKSTPDKSINGVSQTILSVLADYPEWHCHIESAGNDLYRVQWIYSGKQGEKSYESTVFAGSPTE